MRISDCSSDVSSSDLGIMRVRQFTQDDGHIFCREDQIVEEVRDFCALLDRVYRQLGFEKYAVKLALRPDMRFGTDEMWDKAEAELREAVERAGMATEEYGWEEERESDVGGKSE